MSMDAIVAGDYGHSLVLTILDTDTNAAADVSSYSTAYVLLTTPSGTVLTKAATWVTNGSDGQIKYTTTAGDLTVGGMWQVQGRVLTTGTARLTSLPLVFDVTG